VNVLTLDHGYRHEPLLASSHALYLVYAGSIEDPLPESVTSRYELVYYVTGWDSIGQLASIVADLQSREVAVDAIASPGERTQFAAGVLAGLLKLPHPSLPVVLLSRDKRSMKAAAREVGVSTAPIVSVPGSRLTSAVAEDADHIGYPLIVKPASGFGSIATSLVHDEVELAAALDVETDDDLPSPDMAVEEFIDGEEYHVDAVWRDGQPWVFTVSRYATSPRLVRDGVGYLLSILLDPTEHAELYAEARSLHDDLNVAMGIHRGATHLEFFIRPSGELVFSEIATRLAGGNITNLVGAHCGVDLREVYVHELVNGDREELPWAEPAYSYVALLNIAPHRSGTISALPSADAIRNVDGVLNVSIPTMVGDQFVLGHTSAVWTLMIIFGADSEHGVLALADDLTNRFPIEVRPAGS
jgi:hypothetical protein